MKLIKVFYFEIGLRWDHFFGGVRAQSSDGHVGIVCTGQYGPGKKCTGGVAPLEKAQSYSRERTICILTLE